MIVRYLAASGVLAAMLAGCQPTSSEQDPAIELVKSKLKDPYSAEFRSVERHDDITCGEVNAKNSMGGYVGFTPFIVQGTDVAIAPENNSVAEIRLRGKIQRACMAAGIDDQEAFQRAGGENLDELLDAIWSENTLL